MRSIGVQFENGGRRPPTATFFHKGRREEEAPYSTISATALPRAVVSALPPRSRVRSVRSPRVRSIAAASFPQCRIHFEVKSRSRL
jgi:hypothetical protein